MTPNHTMRWPLRPSLFETDDTAVFRATSVAVVGESQSLNIPSKSVNDAAVSSLGVEALVISSVAGCHRCNNVVSKWSALNRTLRREEHPERSQSEQLPSSSHSLNDIAARPATVLTSHSSHFLDPVVARVLRIPGSDDPRSASASPPPSPPLPLLPFSCRSR